MDTENTFSQNRLPETLQLPPEEMRALGSQVIEMILASFEHAADAPLTPRANRWEMERLLREPLPEEGTPSAQVLQQVQQDIFANTLSLMHPRFFGFIPGPSNFVSVMADALAAGLNVFAGAWLASPGPTQVELVTIDWLRQLCGLPETAGGLFVSGGSVATLTALATARHVKLADRFEHAVIYYSDQTHWSVDRALNVLGFSSDQLHKIPSDEHFRLPRADLLKAVAADRAAGKNPFCVIANAGTTNTGAVDPLASIAELCRAEGLWLHVDAAYGGAAMLTEQGQVLLQGIEQADSLVLDPHKWLFQPFEMGCVLIRQSAWLRQTFRMQPEYLKDVTGREEEVNFFDYGIQLTRSTRALKLWMSLKVFGLAAFRQAVMQGIAQAEDAEELLRRAKCWEVVTRAQLGVLTFRYVGDHRGEQNLDEINQRLLSRMVEDGFAFLSSTTLRGKVALRMCMINPRTTQADIRETIQRLERFGRAAEDDMERGGSRAPGFGGASSTENP